MKNSIASKGTFSYIEYNSIIRLEVFKSEIVQSLILFHPKGPKYLRSFKIECKKANPKNSF
jgi:hypothetical protein